MPNAKLVYDTVDLHGVRFAREALAKNNDASLLGEGELYTQMELANVEFADAVIAVTEMTSDKILFILVPNALLGNYRRPFILFQPRPLGLYDREGIAVHWTRLCTYPTMTP